MKKIQGTAAEIIKYRIKYIYYIILLIGSVFFFFGYNALSFNTALTGIIMVFASVVVYGLNAFRRNFLFLFFQVTVFTFLLFRPFWGWCTGNAWWNASSQAAENVWFALWLLYLTEICLLAGAFLADRFADASKKPEAQNGFCSELQWAALLVFSVTIIFYFIEQLEPLLLIGPGNYLKYYTDFTSSLPGLVHTIASFMKYSMCVFLATLPSKKRAFIVLVLYVASTMPSFFIGVRNPFILSLIFSLSYYLLRDFIGDKDKWLGKPEKILMAVGTPLLIVFMVAYTSLRNGESLKFGNIFSMFVDFFYGQGVTFEVLCIGYGYMAGLRILCPVNYTFGGMIDYLYRGTVGQKIFHTEPLTSYNSLFNVQNGNSLSHTLSYLSMPDEYLAGRGRGSSYLLEVFADYGYIGVAVFSLIIGALLILMVKRFGRRVLVSAIILVALENIFFMPRAEATSWMTFLITIQFWACVAGCYFCAWIFWKWNLRARFFNVIKKMYRKEI